MLVSRDHAYHTGKKILLINFCTHDYNYQLKSFTILEISGIELTVALTFWLAFSLYKKYNLVQFLEWPTSNLGLQIERFKSARIFIYAQSNCSLEGTDSIIFCLRPRSGSKRLTCPHLFVQYSLRTENLKKIISRSCYLLTPLSVLAMRIINTRDYFNVLFYFFTFCA